VGCSFDWLERGVPAVDHGWGNKFHRIEGGIL
jgi:hypothetical protein